MSKRFQQQVMEAFGKRLREAREQAGYKHASEFAAALDVEAPTYRYWERGQACPDLTTLTRICMLLKVTPNDLLPLAAVERIEN